MSNIYNMKTLLEIIFKYTKKNARILADGYLLKDVSIISKWRNNVAYPKNDDIIRIVEFVNNEATLSQKELIRDDIEQLLENTPIKSKIKDIIINTQDFSEFLKEAISVSMPDYDGKNIYYRSEKEKRTPSIVKKEPQTKRKETYSGTVDLDFILPEGNNINLQKLVSGSEIEFKGKLNLFPKRETLRIANFFKGSTALGVLLVWVILGGLIVFSVDTSKINPFAYASKSHNVYDESDHLENDLNSLENYQEYNEPAADEMESSASQPLPTPTYEAEPKEINSLKEEGKQEEDNQEEDNQEEDNQEKDKQKENEAVGNEIDNTNENFEQTITNNVVNSSEKTTTNNTEINSWNNFNIQISGENLNLIVGEQNAVSIETN